MKRLWFNNGTEERLIGPNQDVPSGFIKGRIHRETEIDRLSKIHTKEIIYQKYIIENTPFHVLSNQLNITEKQLRKLLTKYNISKSPKESRKNNTYKRSQEEIRDVANKSSKTQKDSWRNKSEEEMALWSEKQKRAHSTESFREAIRIINKEYNERLKKENKELFDDRNRRRSISCKKAWSNQELIEKRNETVKINRKLRKDRVCRTIAEQKMYDTLKEIYTDLQYDIKVDERYPFFCDFYIPSIDVFIELQAHPSHGRLPIEYLQFDEYSKYPAKYADVFAVRDVKKNNIAKQNGINLIRIYPKATVEENIMINKSEYNSLVEMCYFSQKHKFPLQSSGL